MDSMGNVFAQMGNDAGENPVRILLEAHRDRIGFAIKHIAKDGRASIIPLGRGDIEGSLGQVLVFSGSGEDVRGVVSYTDPSFLGNTHDALPTNWEEVYVDFGFSSKEEVLNAGLAVGSMGYFGSDPKEISPSRVMAGGLDNSFACSIILSVLERVDAGLLRDNEVRLSVLFAVNEETGGQGIRAAISQLDIDLAVVLDATFSTDSPVDQPERDGLVQLGHGPTLTFGCGMNPLLNRAFEKLAHEKQIPIQKEVFPKITGTDADTVCQANGGIPTILLSYPLRYMHTASEVVDMADLSSSVELITAFLEGSPRVVLKSIREGAFV